MEWIAPTIVAVGVLAAWVAVSSMQAQLARVERKLNALLRTAGVDEAEGSPLSDRVKLLADDPARKIEAIKVYREETGAGLADAKAAVEAYINGR